MPATPPPSAVPRLSFTLRGRAVVIAIAAAPVLAAILYLGHAGQLPLEERAGSALVLTSWALLGIISCLGERWSIYDDRIERVRYGLFRHVLPFAQLDSVEVCIPNRIPPTLRSVIALRKALDGSTPPLFTLALRGRTPEGSTKSLHLSARAFNYHREATWAFTHLLDYCPPQVQRLGSGNTLRSLLFFVKWFIIVPQVCGYFWAHVLHHLL